MEKFKVTFYPDKKTVEVDKDKTILAAALSCGIEINSACGGDGVCGRCKVLVRKGEVVSWPSAALSAEERRNRTVLACNTFVRSDLEIEIPAQSRQEPDTISPDELEKRLRGVFSDSTDIVEAAPEEETSFQHEPLTTKVFLRLSPPDLNDRVSDLERLYCHLKKTQDLPVLQAALSNVRQLGELLRDSDWKVTVTLGKKNDTLEIMLIEPGNTSSKNFGLCFDVGTTTISCQLVDLNGRRVLGSRASYNKQTSFGSDVITRIIFAKEKDGLLKLHSAVAQTMNQLIKELVAEHKVDLNDVTGIVCSGNTTMLHILLGVDPTYIRREPYVPTANFLPAARAQEAGININPRGMLTCVPGVSSYIGGDTTAGVISSGLFKSEDICVFIDIGTNGEIVLGNKDFMIAAAASAGPAFEGSGLTCGMRASRGAIQKVWVNAQDFEVACNTVGNARPRGICGSGYIDAIACMLKAGIIDKAGKIRHHSNRRVRMGEEGREFVLVFKEDADSTADITISEADIDNLKRSKAAIYSATSILARHMDLDFFQISRFYVAGGFGAFLDIDNAVAIGLLPDLERSKFRFIGNSSLSGARQILLSYRALKLAEEIAKKITYFELSVDPLYMDEYVAALFFPHTDLSRFTSLGL